MHLELMQAYKTTPRPLHIEYIPEPKFFAPTQAIRRKAVSSLPRNAQIVGYEVERDMFRVTYIHNDRTYSATMRTPKGRSC